MRAIDPGWATRFYGMVCSADVAAAAREHTTDSSIADLVDAHLVINRAYFGSIDKTLSGFVILDDDGDDYTLLDLRDGGQIWWQDHDSREVSLRYGSLADLRAVRAAPVAERERVDRQRRAKEPRRIRTVSTAALCARYQWLVWLLAQPVRRDGRPVQSIDFLVRNGIGRLRELFPRPERLDQTFAAELGQLGSDPHLAIYWLLHTTVLADHERRLRVLIAAGASDHPLLRAFVTRFGQLPLAGDVPAVPEFRARRALAMTYGAFEVGPEQLPAACLRALELSPTTNSLVHALQVVAGLDRDGVDDAAVKAALGRIAETTTATALLAAVLDKRAKQMSSAHADNLARLLATCDDPWWAQLEALWLVHELAYDGPALVNATRRILEHDRFHRRALQMAMRAAQIANEPDDAIYNDLGIADALLAPYGRLVEVPDQWQGVVGALPLPPLRRALAWRVLQRIELNQPSPELAAWAAGQVLAGTDPRRAVVVSQALARLAAPAQARMIAAAAAAIDDAAHPLTEVLLAYLAGPELDEHDHETRFQLQRGKEAAVRALAPWLHDPALFDRALAVIERPAAGSCVALFWNKLFSPSEPATYVLPRLSAAQAVRIARALIRTQLRHPSIHARNAAGHQLFRFAHAGAETYLIDALTELAVQNAAIKGPGGAALDHGKTEHDQLADVVANLYAAVSKLGTPAARSALVERLFAERRAYGRMASALADIWDPALHAEILALLAQRHDARAAGSYAYVLADFVQQSAPLVDLVRVVADWQGENEVTRGFLHYALVVGMLAALEAGDLELVRRAHDAASWIADPPLQPEAHARGQRWASPLDHEEVKARIDRALARPVSEATPAAVVTAEARSTPKAQVDGAPKADAKVASVRPATPRAAKTTARPKTKATPTTKATPRVKATATTPKATATPKVKAQTTTPKAAATPKVKATTKSPKPKAAPKAKAPTPKATLKVKATTGTPTPKATPKAKATAKTSKAKAKPAAKPATKVAPKRKPDTRSAGSKASRPTRR